MKKSLAFALRLAALFALAGCQSTGGGTGGLAASAERDREGDAALQQLYASTPAARNLASRAKGILVFPGVVKAGFIVGPQYGKGALRQKGRTVGYYNMVAGSYGL